MANPDTDAIAPDIERPSPAELAPVLTVAHGLTKREQVLTSFVCRGLSTAEIADRRLITPDTIDDHLKSIFDKTGVSTRREIVAAISKEQVPAEGDDGAAPRVVMGSGWRCTGASL